MCVRLEYKYVTLCNILKHNETETKVKIYNLMEETPPLLCIVQISHYMGGCSRRRRGPFRQKAIIMRRWFKENQKTTQTRRNTLTHTFRGLYPAKYDGKYTFNGPFFLCVTKNM